MGKRRRRPKDKGELTLAKHIKKNGWGSSKEASLGLSYCILRATRSQ